jgi:predicted AAA+ superfamily ATPase
MIVVSFETEKNQEEIMDKAVRYFGSIGLKISERGDCCIYFEDENQSGYVKVTLSQKGKKFEVDVESKEFEYHAKKFAKDLK